MDKGVAIAEPSESALFVVPELEMIPLAFGKGSFRIDIEVEPEFEVLFFHLFYEV